jgi:quercetin 2,3-dioxygenase
MQIMDGSTHMYVQPNHLTHVLPLSLSALACNRSGSLTNRPFCTLFRALSALLCLCAVQHTFSFAGYQDRRFTQFHSLRVINEDRVEASEGFGTHPHANAEIFSYVVSGRLSHRDSIGNKEVLQRGDVQFTSAGSGISHSEFNGSDKEPVHFIQIWALPHTKGLPPNYQTRSFDDASKIGALRCIVSPSTVAGGGADTAAVDGTIAINADMHVYASILPAGASVTHVLEPGREAYVHVIQDATGMESEAGLVAVNLNGARLSGGDGAFVRSASAASPAGQSPSLSSLTFTGASAKGKATEFLLFDVKKLPQ